MPDYNETEVKGKRWTRCNVVHIGNPYQGAPTVTFAEENIVEVGQDTFRQQTGQLHFPFDPEAVIELRDPRTGELTGQTTTGAAVYTALYSYYIQSARKRDEEAEAACATSSTSS